jgi:hypothetical protein
MEMLGRMGVPEVRVRYETLIREPKEELVRMLDRLGEPLDQQDLSFISDGNVSLRANHTVMGNPMRMDNGRVQLRIDEQWRTSMARKYRGMVTILTKPLLRRYGYRS